MEQDTDAYMLLQGACVTVKQPFHLNNFIIKSLLVKALN